MKRFTIIIVMLILCITSETLLPAKPAVDSGAEKKVSEPIIVLTGLTVGDTTFELKYKIKNGSDHDVWICDWEDEYGGLQFQVYFSEKGQTLIIHRRLDVLPEYKFMYHPCGHYVRLQAEEERHESLSFGLPVNVRLLRTARQNLQIPTFARRLVLEIGFYNGDLPGMISEVLTEAERLSSTELNLDMEIINKRYFCGLLIKKFLGGLLYFNETNEGLRSRDDEVLIRYTHPPLMGWDVLQINVDNLQIPCQEEKDWLQSRLPFLTPWSRIEIQYQPSMLEYFFPYAGQQSFLTPSEIQYLRSLKTVVINNPEHLRAFASEISKGSRGGIVAKQNTANVTCYRADEYLTSFTIYDNKSMETEEKRWFWYRSGLQSLKKLTPQIQPFDMRVQCAANLKDLWYRLRLYHLAEKRRLKDSSNKSGMVYPIPNEWCDAMERAYAGIGMLEENIMMPHKCPSAGDGKNHYAIDPNCKPDSPPDMVLLFETKAGWNQHGGPELFTFDNHDPKGGCVLLNDGTVKFIRTKEELQQLRWK